MKKQLGFHINDAWLSTGTLMCATLDNPKVKVGKIEPQPTTRPMPPVIGEKK